MGNSLSCGDGSHSWDPHPELHAPYPRPSITGAPDMDMTAPLSHYFISSGHNSYLTGNQLTAASGTSTIEMCLTKGCRVIELDCYNAANEAEGPICKHGGTATAPISFRACVKACKEFGFKTSPYPVILTLENHTDEPNQAAMVAVMKEELGDALFLPPAPETPEWRSPEDLKGKFLIRTNTSKAGAELRGVVYIANTKFKGFAEMMKLDHVTSSSLVESKIEDMIKPIGMAISKTMKGADAEKAAAAASKAADKAKASGKGPSEGDQDDDDSSGAVGTLLEAFAYTSAHLLRVYPAGWRIASGNYDPSPAWSLGASFVALNWQAWDKPVWINEAKFLDNGGCGYIKKPEWMTKGEGMPERQPRTLVVHVYSAFKKQKGLACMCMKDDLIVCMETKGAPVDVHKKKTDYVQDSGKLHVDKAFEFPIYYPELAQLLLCVDDQDTGSADDTLGYFSLSLASLQPGKYQINMLDPNGGSPMADCWIKVELRWGDTNPIAEGPPTAA